MSGKFLAEDVIRAKLRPILRAIGQTVGQALQDEEISAEKAELIRLCLSQAEAVIDVRRVSMRGDTMIPHLDRR